MKLIDLAVASNNIRSHSARSAWIETADMARRMITWRVALRKECVD